MIAFPDRGAIQVRQLTTLGAMLGTLARSNRFYARKWAASGFDAAPGSLEAFFRTAPFTVKQEVVDDQRAAPPYGTNLTYSLDRYTRFSQTSGTTGVPLRWLDTTEAWSWMVDNWVQVFRASGADLSDRVFFAFSFGPFLGFWTAYEACIRMGALALPGGGMSTTARLQTIMDNRATVLCCTPTYAIRLGEAALEEGVDLSQGAVRLIIAAGEPGAAIPATRQYLERLWPGAQVRDHHGMTEIGPVTFECPARPGVLHVLEDAFIPEVLDPVTLQPAGAGQRGELILTNLGRWGSPLVRYRTGDIVLPATQAVCDCGRSDLALEGGILGRTDDMVFVRGVNVFPSAVEETVRRFSTVAEYRVEVRTESGMTELALQLEPDPSCPEPSRLAREVETALRSSFNLRIPVSLVAPGALPRFELKAKRWVRVNTGS
ncbi:MAG: phenylacetate--CoA ligase family protein [Armatimonadetes bacterium]|jgi:phenylacetate-CoA ligase|nr:phenylacetate--CoA ligase family protein [Armatimonadota bacterium]